ncbi:Crp/Fnr family transcriptional regulator [Chitinophaga silvisoli]|uniref:Crp/Fnr family transcriptional regulator n=1 Tax=Chitinophaga silvisoli TaxID=2291814 RepID=A0A3E1NT73_9BACT|nr:Crp/Fnr family transcriptional regulator [Chitinophaga silvisoli]RFM31113.1 Crp/Fnr family transcriptional regulator [Chitinophaga silvisoli]
MEAFTNYLLQFGHLNEQQIRLIHSKLTLRHLPKGAYLSEAGQVARELAFVVDGVLRSSFYNNKGEDVTHYFITENHFYVDIDSFLHKMFSMGYVQAVTDCELIIIKIEDYEELSATILDWDLIFQKVANKFLIEKMNRLKLNIMEEAQVKYELFLQNFPGLVNRVPLVYVASFLGITPSSLSRIRRKK